MNHKKRVHHRRIKYKAWIVGFCLLIVGIIIWKSVPPLYVWNLYGVSIPYYWGEWQGILLFTAEMLTIIGGLVLFIKTVQAIFHFFGWVIRN